MKIFLPLTLDELWAFWDKMPEAGIYAGGTDFMVKLREGVLKPTACICLERIPALKDIREEKDTLLIGAGASHTTLLHHPLILTHAPVLAGGLRVLGSPLIRNMGTLGGNIATASPAGDTLPALYVLDAQVILADAHETRMLPVSDFILGPGKTALKKQEIISAVRIRKTAPDTCSHYEKAGKRKAMAIAVASLASCLRLSLDGVIEEVRLAWGSIGPTIVTLPQVETALKGQRLHLGLLKEVASIVEEAVFPIDDIRASAVYRKTVAGHLLCRLAKFSPFRSEGA